MFCSLPSPPYPYRNWSLRYSEDNKAQLSKMLQCIESIFYIFLIGICVWCFHMSFFLSLLFTWIINILFFRSQLCGSLLPCRMRSMYFVWLLGDGSVIVHFSSQRSLHHNLVYKNIYKFYHRYREKYVLCR